jgi:hypothetical protein
MVFGMMIGRCGIGVRAERGALQGQGRNNAGRRLARSGLRMTGAPPGSGVSCFSQDRVERVLELELLLFHLLDLQAMRSHDAGFHVLDLLVEFIVAMEDAGEVVVLDLQARNQISVLWEHSTLLTDAQKNAEIGT